MRVHKPYSLYSFHLLISLELRASCRNNNFHLKFVFNECFQIQVTTSSIVALPQKNEAKLFVNGSEISDEKPVTISKIEVIENKSAILEPSTAAEIKPESTPIKAEETKGAADKNSFIVTPDYIQQSMLFRFI